MFIDKETAALELYEAGLDAYMIFLGGRWKYSNKEDVAEPRRLATNSGKPLGYYSTITRLGKAIIEFRRAYNITKWENVLEFGNQNDK
jgi:hypothetical protein